MPIDAVYASLANARLVSQLLNPDYNRGGESKYLNNLLGRAYYYEDSDDIKFVSLDLFYQRARVSGELGVGVDAGSFSIEKKDVQKYEGMRYGATLFYQHWRLRLGINKYKDFSEFTPTLSYKNRYRQHQYTLEFTRQNALFYTYSLCPYEKRLSVNHFQATDYMDLGNHKELWMGVDFDAYDNSNKAVTAQFDYLFYYNTVGDTALTYKFALEGWYASHSNPNDCYYSPSFYDSTLLRIEPEYYLSQALQFKTMAGLGYSIKTGSRHYKYGAWLKGSTLDTLEYSVGCLQSNSSRGSATGAGDYSYIECKAELGYQW